MTDDRMYLPTRLRDFGTSPAHLSVRLAVAIGVIVVILWGKTMMDALQVLGVVAFWYGLVQVVLFVAARIASARRRRAADAVRLQQELQVARARVRELEANARDQVDVPMLRAELTGAIAAREEYRRRLNDIDEWALRHLTKGPPGATYDDLHAAAQGRAHRAPPRT